MFEVVELGMSSQGLEEGPVEKVEVFLNVAVGACVVTCHASDTSALD